jgi:hypothetical protein
MRTVLFSSSLGVAEGNAVPVACLLAAVGSACVFLLLEVFESVFGTAKQCGLIAVGGVAQARKVVGLVRAQFWTFAAGLCLFCLVVGAAVDRLCMKEQVKVLFWIPFPNMYNYKVLVGRLLVPAGQGR